MVSIGEALYESFGGELDESDYDDPDNWGYDVHQLYGSISRAARELGVPRTTLRGWLSGEHSPKRGDDWFSDKLQRAARRNVDHLRNVRASDVHLVATFKYAGGHAMKGTEDRTIPIGDYVTPYVFADLAEAYENGAGPEELSQIFADNIIDGGFYADTFSGDRDGEWDIHAIEGL